MASGRVNKVNGQRRVGLLYDERMCMHFNPLDPTHPEAPDRIRVIWNKLKETGICNRCVILDAKEAEDKYLQAVHSKNHVNQIKNISSRQYDFRRDKIASKLNSIYFNEGSSKAAYLAAGCAVEVVEKVASRELHSAVAIVRPPGHHAERPKAMGFCLFNNVAISATYLLDQRPDLGIKKILIVDWDVHHGNGTQKTFYNDSRVLFFSVHRHESGRFYPGGDDGFYTMIGEGAGAGYNINVPWENGQCGDADYFAAWDHILLPVAKEFNPDIILVSAGFDAAVGDPLGECCVTPFGYSVMLEKLMKFTEGRIALILEGGYNLDSIAMSMYACVETLLEGKPVTGSLEAYPFESTWRVIQAVRRELSPFWPTLASELPQNLICLVAPPPHTHISSSESETEDDIGTLNSKNLGELLQDVIIPLSNLKVDADEHWSNMSSKALKLAMAARKRQRADSPSSETAPAEVSTDTASTDSAPRPQPTPPTVIIVPPPPQSPNPSTEVVNAADTPPSSAGPRRGIDILPRPPTTTAKPSVKETLIKMSGAEWKRMAEELACQLKRSTTMFNVLAGVADDVAEGVSPAKEKARAEMAAEVAGLRSIKDSADQKLAELEEKHRQQMEELLKNHEEALAQVKADARTTEEAAREAGRQEGLAEVERVSTLLKRRAAQALRYKVAAVEANFDFEKGGGKIFANAVEQILHLNQGLRVRVVGACAGFGVENGKMVDWERDGAEVDLDQPEENLPNPLVEKLDEEFNPSTIVLSDVEDDAAGRLAICLYFCNMLDNQETDASNTWRSELSNIDIWYASYGSNMWKSRFLCYVAGGQVEGMQRHCSGSVDKAPPKEIQWKTFPCPIFFGRDSSRSWGPGGVAFINPDKNFQHNTYMCLYKISLEQFNDILLQENGLSLDAGSPLFDITALDAISDKEFITQEAVKGSWYGNVVYLGKEHDIPIITMTCSSVDIERFKTGELPLRAPNKAYANTLIKGLVEGEQLSEVDAIAYVEEAAAKPL